jgi:hypothetical protein
MLDFWKFINFNWKHASEEREEHTTNRKISPASMLKTVMTRTPKRLKGSNVDKKLQKRSRLF